MAFGGRVARLVWRKRRWRCPDDDCPVGSWTEQSEVIGARSSLTERAKVDM
jgi:transposase